MYINKEQIQKDKERVEDEEVILIKLYKISKLTSTKSLSFVNEEVDNLLKYMKFIKSPTQTRIFQPPPHDQALRSRGELLQLRNLSVGLGEEPCIGFT